jgi:hypothetical protein
MGVTRGSSVARRAGGGRPFAGAGQPEPHDFQAGQVVPPVQRCTLPRSDAKRDLAPIENLSNVAFRLYAVLFKLCKTLDGIQPAFELPQMRSRVLITRRPIATMLCFAMAARMTCRR